MAERRAMNDEKKILRAISTKKKDEKKWMKVKPRQKNNEIDVNKEKRLYA